MEEGRAYRAVSEKVRFAHRPQMMGALDRNFSRWVRVFTADGQEVWDMGGRPEDLQLGPYQGLDQHGMGDNRRHRKRHYVLHPSGRGGKRTLYAFYILEALVVVGLFHCLWRYVQSAHKK